MLIVESQSMDVYRNLAIEEYLMDHVAGRGPILFLWRSDCAVVIGKNQNPWRECRLDLMQADGIPLARRVSGGGAVYHDTGNLNYCVIVDRNRYRKQQAYEMVIAALQEFDLTAEQTGSSNLSVNGRKFSGNAFCFRRERVMHHGTLLLSTALDRLGKYLGSAFEKLETRAIASVPAEVRNLGISLKETSAVLERHFILMYGGGIPERLKEDDLDGDRIRSLMDRLSSAAWLYESTPRFTVRFRGLAVEVDHGIVTAAEGQAAGWTGRHFLDLTLSPDSQIDVSGPDL